jgi:hypothetical protein
MLQRSASAIWLMPSDHPDAPVYRCYFLDARGRVGGVAVLEQRDDAAAVQAALALLAARNAQRRRFFGVELWDRGRRVHVAAPAAAQDEDRQAIA